MNKKTSKISHLFLKQLLPHLMRPAGGGIPSFSAGKGIALPLQKDLYQIFSGSIPQDEKEISLLWQESWKFLDQAKVALIGAPSDTGAGIRRGAAYGPLAIRKALLQNPIFQGWIQTKKVIDLGDIYVNPHLLHDGMLNSEQIKLCQNAMYPNAPDLERTHFCVSPLSQLKQILSALLEQHGKIKLFIIGGDHSVAWPVTEVLAKKYPGTLGVVQPDAHTDLLKSRLGVQYCFGTWSYHANELIGRNGKLVQLGIRQSGKDKKYWESSTQVKQYWADDIQSMNPDQFVMDLVQHLKERGVKQIYFSNDIDGTDETEASATGTPAPNGLRPEFLEKVIQGLGQNFELVAADIVEVAPDLAPSPEEREKTGDLAARYAIECLSKQIGKSVLS